MKSRKPKPSRKKTTHPALETKRKYSKAQAPRPSPLSPLGEACLQVHRATDLRSAGQVVVDSLVDPQIAGFSGALIFVHDARRGVMWGVAAAVENGQRERDELRAFIERIRLPIEPGTRHPLAAGLRSSGGGLQIAGRAAAQLAQALEPALVGDRFWLLPVPGKEAPLGVVVLGGADSLQAGDSRDEPVRTLVAHLGVWAGSERTRGDRASAAGGMSVVSDTVKRGLTMASLGELLKTVTRGATQAAGAARGFLWTVAERGGALQRAAETTLAQDECCAEAAEQADALAERCLKRRAALLIPDLRGEQSLGLQSLAAAIPAIVVPIAAFGELHGILAVIGRPAEDLSDTAERGFSEDEQRLLTLLAAHAAVAIQTAGLYERTRRAEKRLAETQEMLLQHEKLAALGELSGKLAQEIRNPLVTLGGFARRIEHDLDPEDPQRENAALIAVEARRLEEMLDQQIEMAQAAAPRMALHQLNEVVQECVGLLRDDVLARGVLLEETYSDRLPDLLLDRQRMKQVIVNVLRSAIDSVSDGDTIRVETFRQRDRALLELAHSGEKPRGELIEEVFVPFQTPQLSGSGLGLALAHQIVKEHGGEIGVRSEGDWSAVFTIAIPIWSNRERRKLRDRRRARDRRKR